MGTATTIDVISKEFNYLGGIILPGSLTALSSLINKTSLIGNHSILVDDKLLGLSTKECLSSGFVNGQVLMIKGIIDEIRRTHQISFKVIFTGGVSNLFLSFFPEYEFDSNLLFKGMAFKLLEDL
jgi:type III pantothenate kinase